jgi:hypothetical protein
MRKWRHVRSEHAEVLSGLERAIAAHPAGGRSVTRRSEPKAVTRVPREHASDGSDAA